VSTNDRDGGLGRVLFARNFGNEGLSAYDVESGDTEELLGVEDTSLLEDLGGDRYGRVHGVRDDENECLGADLGDALDEALHDARVDVEKVVTGHTRLAWTFFVSDILKNSGFRVLLTGNTGGNDNNVSTLEGLLDALTILW
jgi:hypothetical protein